ncbi:MAG: hypothetical protein KAJ33_04800 [Thermoplasmata archaeon]|nr:hypothetical protein [Thermoplasmata archaeon]MCK5397548.1 hypothetical protein [Thermoplasmata archaeon]
MRADVRIDAEDKAQMLANALRPEMEQEVSRTRVDIRAEGSELIISIQAEDVVALRASLNSYLRWTKLAIDSQEAIGDE